MAKRKKNKNSKRKKKKDFSFKRKTSQFSLPEEIKNYIGGTLIFLLAIIVFLSFFELSGIAGEKLFKFLSFFVGKVVYTVPFILILVGCVFFVSQYKNFLFPNILAFLILVLGIAGIFGAQNSNQKLGGWLGYLVSWPFLKLFGFWVTNIIFLALVVLGGIILGHFLTPIISKEKPKEEEEKRKSIISQIFKKPDVKLKIKEIEPEPAFPKGRVAKAEKEPSEILKPVPEKVVSQKTEQKYEKPPLKLLESDKELPSVGDIRINSAIIKKTLENFSIPVEMGEVNIGPTVTQYTLKPAEGIKLSKITALANDLALALASHPIRIEAPIPGKPLVGVEVPNKVRATVRLRDLITSPQFQNSSSDLTIVLGRDVSGNPVYADLARMPHLMVAGSTGTGKTVFLNALIISLLYQNPPENLRLILIDPKRVEFSIYRDLPHLLAPPILNAHYAVNALKWLIGEMERRFDLLAKERCRDIASYNQAISKKGNGLMPYIVLVIDELADLMAAKGREIEAGIVRLAQMARAVGIHLVVATQRPSVEVITGLIKANITSRVTFQVASQVDSRTVLDMAGAEKLLGRGDMLFISPEVVKPRRIQSPLISEKEVKKVVKWFAEQAERFKEKEGVFENHLAEEFLKGLETLSEGEATFSEASFEEEDPLYEEAKRVVIEAGKASASLLQRRLRIGYARAARLIDMLEERGIVGPADGAKPREILIGREEYLEKEEDKDSSEGFYEEPNEDPEKGWQKL